ncbi:MAG: bifunctional 4-hydroxy-2-oxoglutarate aldolase/2-dehydro-3-deoxy-phosphogluconate aldolase [Anaerolineales bacterium]|nr:bifunctional 4-hydroxy-2-oxoglutarate aldolase/2-dehydro-3-deoxy-phosphogluconate aldolase [Anaerolineales bacterium]
MNTLETILQKKIIAIIRLENYDRALEVAQALVAGGISVMEFTLTGRGATEAVSRVRAHLGAAACVGVGTVLSVEAAQASIEAGAQFIVTPAVRVPVIAECVRQSIPIACGALTPTELLEAHEAGSELVKLFPAQTFGPKYIKDVLAPFPFLKLVPTGGVSPENAREYLAAGAVAVGIGGNLVSKSAVSSGNFAAITAAAQACVQAVG